MKAPTEYHRHTPRALERTVEHTCPSQAPRIERNRTKAPPSREKFASFAEDNAINTHAPSQQSPPVHLKRGGGEARLPGFERGRKGAQLAPLASAGARRCRPGRGAQGSLHSPRRSLPLPLAAHGAATPWAWQRFSPGRVAAAGGGGTGDGTHTTGGTAALKPRSAPASSFPRGSSSLPVLHAPASWPRRLPASWGPVTPPRRCGRRAEWTGGPGPSRGGGAGGVSPPPAARPGA